MTRLASRRAFVSLLVVGPLAAWRCGGSRATNHEDPAADLTTVALAIGGMT